MPKAAQGAIQGVRSDAPRMIPFVESLPTPSKLIGSRCVSSIQVSRRPMQNSEVIQNMVILRVARDPLLLMTGSGSASFWWNHNLFIDAL